MGRRSIISQRTINQLVSAVSRHKRERERDALIKSLDMRRELPLERTLISVDFSPETRMTKIVIKEEKPYRTVERYITRNYVKYPVLSEWKTKIKHINKSIKLTNDALEHLNHHSEACIRDLAMDIILKIGNDEYYPSWFLNEVYRLEYIDISKRNDEEIEAKKAEFASLKSKIEKENGSHQFRIQNLYVVEGKQQWKFDDISEKYTKALNRKKSIFLNIITLGIYSHICSKGYIDKLKSKMDLREKELALTRDAITQKEEAITTNSQALEDATINLEKAIQALENSTKEAKRTMEERIRAITPLASDIGETDTFVSLKKFIGIEYKEIKGCYIIRNKENKKCYVGQSKDVLRRIKQHFRGTEAVSRVFLADYYNTKFEDSSNLFEVRIVTCDTKDELDQREKELIVEYDAYNNGYNNTQGNK